MQTNILKRLRKFLKLTQAELAIPELANCSVTTLVSWEKNDSMPFDAIKRICDKFPQAKEFLEKEFAIESELDKLDAILTHLKNK